MRRIRPLTRKIQQRRQCAQDESGKAVPSHASEHMQADGRIGNTDCLGNLRHQLINAAAHCRAERNGNCSFCSFGRDVKTK